MKNYSCNPKSMIVGVFHNKDLILELVKRDVIGRYRGSIMGLLWSFFYPILMLTIYTFVFSVVFKARWAGGAGSKTEFALALFCGLIVFGLFSECVARAPGLITGNVNYVKKVIFPLEVFPLVSLGASTFHFFVSLLVWLIFYIIFFGVPLVSFLLLPIVVLPLIFFTLGGSWILASLGVYLRDVSQIIGVIITVLMYLSPVFYPVSAIPERFHFYMHLNPLTFAIEQSRSIMIFGGGIDWLKWACQMGSALMFAWGGFAWFQKTRQGFADVL
ncbi:ABC transporter permease [Jeongeupia wiesaeckerbachi]|uniref:ABC transporter permease n=1 Tax=Jeongeupia wiesaeckerbachi TaxID=3051218 RepID=UPI003D80301E